MVPKVKCIYNQLAYTFYFYSNDHEPPHVHVKRAGGEWEIRVYFLLCTKDELKYDVKKPFKLKRIMSRDEKEILELICKKREQLYNEWCNVVKTNKRN